MSSIELLSDQALGEGIYSRGDGLGFNTYAKVLSAAAKGTPGPFSIGVFGEWGTGKTSLLHLIETELSNEEYIVTVWFNAWRYEKEDHPIVPLIGTIVRELQNHQEIHDGLINGIRDLVAALRAVAYGFSSKSKVKIPGLAEIEASFVAKDMIEKYDGIKHDPLLDKSLYYETFEQLSKLCLNDKIKVVVLIDDLDRCLPDLAIKLLESIKLILCQPNFIFIIGVARSIVEGYLNYKYREEYGISDFNGHSYLDKIIQLPFYLPPLASRMNSLSLNILQALDNNSQEKLKNILPIIGSATGANPRATVRFVNNLLIDIGINEELAKNEEMGYLPIEFFAISRCLQQRWPKFFRLLVMSDELCSDISQWDMCRLRSESTSEIADNSFVAMSMLSDRDLRNLLSSQQGKEWLKDSERRRQTVEFLSTTRLVEGKNKSIDSKPFDIFLSCSPDDHSAAIFVAEALSNENIRSMVDVITQDAPQLLEHLNVADAIGICIGHSNDNFGIRFDVQYVMDNLGEFDSLQIIPILLPNSALSDLPEILRSINFIDMREGVSDSAIKSLSAMLRI